MREAVEQEARDDLVSKIKEIEKNKDLVSACVLGVIGIDGQKEIYFAYDDGLDVLGLTQLLDMHIKEDMLANIRDDEEDDD